MRDMNMLNPKKIAAILVSFLLVFLQTVPVAVAASKPEGLIAETTPTLEKDAHEATKTSVQPAATVPSSATQSSADFLASNTTISRTTVTNPIVAPKPRLPPTKIPKAVQALAKQLQSQLGTGYLVSVSLYNNLNKTYGISVVNKVSSSKLAQGSFQNMTVTVDSKAFVLQIDAMYRGVPGVNGKMLYDGVAQISKNPLIAMTRIVVKGNDLRTATVTIQYENYQYKITKGKDGKVVIAPVTPPAVTDCVNKLKTGLGHYSLMATWIKGTHPPQYQVSIADNAVYAKAPTQGLHAMDFVLSRDGKLDEATLQASYYGTIGDIKVDAKLLYQAMGVCPQGQICTMQVVSQIETLKKLTSISVRKVDEIGAIHFTKDGINYKVTRDATGKVVLEKELPNAVQAYVDQLQKSLPNYKITVENLDECLTPGRCYPGHFRISLLFSGEVLQPGQLKGIEIMLNKDGSVTGLGRAEYNSIGFVDVLLLPAGMKLLQPGAGDAEALVLMTQITVTKVDENGSIYFKISSGEHYKISRNGNGNIGLLLEKKELPDGAVQYFDEEGCITKEERPDGSKTEYLYGSIVFGNGWTQRGVIGAIYTRPDGKQVRVNFDQAPGAKFISGVGGIRDPGMAAIEAAVVDLLSKNEISGGTLVLKNYAVKFLNFMCTAGIPPSCSGDMGVAFDLESNAVIYSYHATVPMDSLDRGRKIEVTLVSKTVIIPPAVRAFVEQLQKTLGYGYVVGGYRGDPYHISVDFRTTSDDGSGAIGGAIFLPSAGQLVHMDFLLTQDAQINVGTLQATYHTAGGDVSADAQLLYDGMRALFLVPSVPYPVIDPGYNRPDPEIERRLAVGFEQMLLDAMTQISVVSVDSNGAIHFTKDGINYKCFRDANNQIRLQIVIADTYFEAIAQADIAGVINSSLSGTDRDLALAALNGMPSGAICYKVSDAVGNVIGYQGEPQPLNPAIMRRIFIPQNVAPVSSRSEIYSNDQKTGEMQVFVLGPTGPAITFSMMPPPDPLVPTDRVRIYDLRTGNLSSEIHYDAQGNITRTIYYNVPRNRINNYLGLTSVTGYGLDLPGTLTCYGADGKEIRTIVVDVNTQSATVTIDAVRQNESPSYILWQDASGRVGVRNEYDRGVFVSYRTYGYDAQNRIEREQFFTAAGECTKIEFYSYDSTGSLASIRYATPAGVNISEVYFDLQGNVTRTTFYQYDWNSLSLPQASVGAIVFPSISKHYDANGTLLREFQMNVQGQIVSMTVYGSASVAQLPAKLKVIDDNGNLYSEIAYAMQGGAAGVIYYQYGCSGSPLQTPGNTGIVWAVQGANGGPQASLIDMGGGVKFPEIQIYRKDGDNFYQIASINGNGYLRSVLPPSPGQNPEWGTSWVLPGYWDENNQYHHNMRITKGVIETRSDGSIVFRGELSDDTGKLTSKDFQIRFPPYARDENGIASAVDTEVSFTLQAAQGLKISPSRYASGEGFRIAQWSSMYINPSTHDADQVFIKDANGNWVSKALRNDGTLLFNSPQTVAGGEVVLANVDPTRGAPNTRIIMTEPAPAADPMVTQFYMARTTDPNDDNVGGWLQPQGLKPEYLAGEMIGHFSYTLRVEPPGAINQPILPAVLLDRTSITQSAYDHMKTQWGWAQSYGEFIQAGYTSEQVQFLQQVFTRAMSLDPADFQTKLAAVRHIVFMNMPSLELGGSGYPPEGVLILNNHVLQESLDWGVALLMHEATHLKDFSSNWPVPQRDQLISEAHAYQGDARWMQLLGFPQDVINREQFIAEHIPDNDYGGIVAQAVLDPEHYGNQALLPLQTVETYFQGFGISGAQYLSSVLMPRDLYDSPVQGYDFVFQADGRQHQIFIDMTGEWIFYNGQWVPQIDQIISRLMDSANITETEYNEMVAYDRRVTAGFVRLPATYEALVSQPPSQPQVNEIAQMLRQAFALDPARFYERMACVRHIALNDYGQEHGAAHNYPPSGTIILNTHVFETPPPPEDGQPVLFLGLQPSLIFHEAVHLQDLAGNPNPSLRDFRVSERNAYAEEAHWDFLLGNIDAYNFNQFIADRIPDNDYDNTMAAAVSNDSSLWQRVLAPLASAGWLAQQAALIDPKYISSTVVQSIHMGASLQGYDFVFQANGQQYQFFVDMSGEWIFYNGQWVPQMGLVV